MEINSLYALAQYCCLMCWLLYDLCKHGVLVSTQCVKLKVLREHTLSAVAMVTFEVCASPTL